MVKATAPRGSWTIVALLFCFMLINFADKAVIGLAGVPIMHDLHLTPKQFGLVNASFFFLFSLSAVATGFIVNHVQARWALLVMGVVWALAQFPMLGSASLGTLIACRVLLGAGEGPAYSVALHATYQWFPDELRTLPTSIIAQGAACGVILAAPLLERVIEGWSWHWAFGTLGVVGLLWSIAWFFLGEEGSVAATVDDRDGAGGAGEAEGAGKAGVPYRRLLGNGTTLSCFAAGFGAYWGLSLLLGWFTPYLIQGLGLTQRQASWVTSLPWAASPFIVVFAGWLSQHLVARGTGTRLARGIFAGACVTLGGACIVLMPASPGNAAKIVLMIGGISLASVIYVIGPAVVSEITPPRQRSAMLAINTAVGTSAGLLGPYVMGSVVQGALERGAPAAAGYGRGFLICGLVTTACGLAGMIFLRPESEVARFAALGRPAPSIDR